MRDCSVKDSILESAAQLFMDHGYVGTSMNAVAQDADESKSSVFYHFTDKETLFKSALALIMPWRSAAPEKENAKVFAFVVPIAAVYKKMKNSNRKERRKAILELVDTALAVVENNELI